MSLICFTLTRRFAIRILSVLLILLFLLLVTISPIVTAKAFAATLTVVGTVALTMATIASIYMICAGASGMDGAVRNQARATGTQPLDYMGQLLNRWLSATGVLPATLATKFQQGFSYLPDGTLFLDNDCTEAVSDFQRWAWDEDGAGLKNYDVSTIDESVATVNGVSLATAVTGLPSATWSGRTYYAAPELRLATLNESDGGRTIAAASSDAVRVFACILQSDSRVYLTSSTNRVYVRACVMLRSGDLREGLYGGAGYINSSWFRTSLQTADGAGVYLPVVQSLPNWSDLVNAQIGISETLGNPNTFYGPAQQDKGTQIAAGSAVTVSPEAAANLHIANYLRAMAAAYAGTGVADVPVTDTGTGEEETLPLSVPLDTPLTVTGISDSAIDQSGSVAVSDSVSADFTGLDDYTMDLTRFFPFCIPFDLAALFQKFEAEAAAPVVDIPFPNPADPDGTPLSVHVDLTPFDELAAVVRKLELVAFVIGLCFLTKRLIQGGD